MHLVLLGKLEAISSKHLVYSPTMQCIPVGWYDNCGKPWNMVFVAEYVLRIPEVSKPRMTASLTMCYVNLVYIHTKTK